jgi:hypothetical protein
VTATLGQLALGPAAAAGLRGVPIVEANRLLVAWGHYLGACRRPFGQQAWALVVGAEPVAVAVSASPVAATTAGYRRSQLVELARLCSAERWATRVMLRLWREVAGPAWPYWPARAAIAYSQNDRHEGRIYRFDGWERVTARAGSNGGGAWSRPRHPGDMVHGPNTLWLWRYNDPPDQPPATEQRAARQNGSEGHTAPHPGDEDLDHSTTSGDRG